MEDGNEEDSKLNAIAITTATPTATSQSATAGAMRKNVPEIVALPPQSEVAEEKKHHSDDTLDQILKAHREQSLIAARVELGQQQPGFIASEQSSSGLGFQRTKPDVKLDDKSLVCARLNEAVGAAGDDALGTGRTLRTAVETEDSGVPTTTDTTENEGTSMASIRSIGSLVCRICHNSENPEKLVSPCLCKGSLTYVHIYCLERWISTSRTTSCELCQFQYNTQQTLRYTCFQSLRMWYSRSMSRRALQEDCQMFSLLTLVAFGIIGTLLVGIQYYFLQGRNWGLGRLWTKGWLIFFLFTTSLFLVSQLAVYFINIYMIVRSQLAPWYRWWQSARDIRLILENRKPFNPSRKLHSRQVISTQLSAAMYSQADPQYPPQQQHPNVGEEGQSQPQFPASPHLPPPQPLPTAVATMELKKELPTARPGCNRSQLPTGSGNAVSAPSAMVEIPLDGYAYDIGNIM